MIFLERLRVWSIHSVKHKFKNRLLASQLLHSFLSLLAKNILHRIESINKVILNKTDDS